MLSEFSERGCQGCDPRGTLTPFSTRAEAWRHRWGPRMSAQLPHVLLGKEETT